MINIFFFGFNFDNRNFDLNSVVKYANFVNGLFRDKSITVFHIACPQWCVKKEL